MNYSYVQQPLGYSSTVPSQPSFSPGYMSSSTIPSPPNYGTVPAGFTSSVPGSYAGGYSLPPTQATKVSNPLSTMPYLVKTSRVVDVMEADKQQIMRKIEEARREGKALKQRPEGFDPNKYVSFKAYEKTGQPMAVEEVIPR